MPELPEVRAAAKWLTTNLAGERVEKVSVGALSFVKTYDPPPEALVGLTLETVSGRGKFLIIDFSGVEAIHAVVHLSLGGWLKWRKTAPANPLKLGKQPVAIRVVFDSGGAIEITEAGTEKRAAMWITRSLNDVDRLQEVGPDADDPSLTPERLGEILDGLGASPLKSALRNQRGVAGIGNAWSDEILHRAKLSPFTRANKLDKAKRQALFVAIREVLAEAGASLEGLPLEKMKDSKRGSLKIHNHAGDVCWVCGTTVASVGGSGSSSFQYCPGCQTGGRVLSDRRLSRLLT